MQISIFIAHGSDMKEIYYLNFQNALQKPLYEDHQWNICTDLIVIALLTRLQQGFTIASDMNGTAKQEISTSVWKNGHCKKKIFTAKKILHARC